MKRNDVCMLERFFVCHKRGQTSGTDGLTLTRVLGQLQGELVARNTIGTGLAVGD